MGCPRPVGGPRAIEGTIKGTPELRMAKYTQALTYVADEVTWTNTTYLLTGGNFTLFVYEGSTDGGLIEPYLWSMTAP